ncbi:histone-lysine N-methyltransferase SETMAR [Plakobranchus ocellatus]|uniref:Histone-lysine N-methyltransferase SETMAR n=1 Tax=Plakobranchus ocellatus TaxID=259542 RepID=A0AAV3ZD42_9GAST|nr:histone-lysine N-methyltransferase SETMAR [Plakobranchus ocellatus]
MSVSSILALTILCGVHLTLACDPEEQTACSRISDPVCATFHKTFANDCVMKNELCRLAKEGFHFTGSNCTHELALRSASACNFGFEPIFETEDDLISELRNWFDNLDVDFFRVGINSLLSRWQKCIDLHGDYVEK